MTTITNLPQATLVSTLHAMEDKGYYNDHSQLQHSTIPYALPFLRHAASSIQLPDHHSPVVLADYGSSQGHNSLQTDDDGHRDHARSHDRALSDCRDSP